MSWWTPEPREQRKDRGGIITSLQQNPDNLCVLALDRSAPSGIDRVRTVERTAEAGWYPDPIGAHELRYFDGASWTNSISNNGTAGQDDAVRAGSAGISEFELWWSSEPESSSYLGSHPTATDEAKTLTLGFSSEGFFSLTKKSDVSFAIKWTDIRRVRVESQESVNSRITATRVILMGGFGVLAKKTTRRSFLTIETHSGPYVFAVEGIGPADLWAQLLKVKARTGDLLVFGDEPKVSDSSQTTPPVPPHNSSAFEGADVIGARLARIDQLLAMGAITSEEHTAQRRAIIGGL